MQPKKKASPIFHDFVRAAELLDNLPNPSISDLFNALEREPNPVIMAVLDSYFAEMAEEPDKWQA